MRIPTNAMSIAVPFLSLIGDIKFTLNLEPICPPIKTVNISKIVILGSIEKVGLRNCPPIPAIELTKIKKLDVAAILFGVSHFVK